jgi:hypothetical protein
VTPPFLSATTGASSDKPLPQSCSRSLPRSISLDGYQALLFHLSILSESLRTTIARSPQFQGTPPIFPHTLKFVPYSLPVTHFQPTLLMHFLLKHFQRNPMRNALPSTAAHHTTIPLPSSLDRSLTSALSCSLRAFELMSCHDIGLLQSLSVEERVEVRPPTPSHLSRFMIVRFSLSESLSLSHTHTESL